MEFTKLRKMQGLIFSVVPMRSHRRSMATLSSSLRSSRRASDKLGCIEDDDAVRTQGIACVENIASKHGHIKYTVLSLVASARIQSSIRGQYGGGAKADVVEYNVGTFSMMANICARTVAESDGMVMVLADTKTDKMVACTSLPRNAGEMISEGVIGIKYGAASEVPGRTFHAHPTLSEAFQESCVAAFDKPITFEADGE
ncbi:unnamed protein product [Peronospora farinosa]|uniref:Pyridine nucleotide-disulphide oxidoreductase dimerisation domain-containing protein n=1 Tax=Peronospora farinosa TaxID=134698 RepID=A0AAV0U5H9_9STRA|nr:unnamed protein product [Peronospora farinosa]